VVCDTTPVSFAVRPGSSASDIADDLQRAGLIRSAAAFRVQAELRGLSSQLRVGEYELNRAMSLPEVMDTLAGGRTRRGGLVTIPEGWRAEEVAAYLQTAGVIDAAEFVELVAGREQIDGIRLPAGASSFEGYLFPETYEFGREPTAARVFQRLTAEFERRVDPSIQANAAERGLHLHELITLASIIEREAVDPDERADIAAVFHNRLARGMPLQADPTTQYALVPFGRMVDAGTYWKRVLTAADLQSSSPYNTYRVTGLPPGPICNPGLASIVAAANPSKRPWLYFVAKGDGTGTHYFAETLDEHLRNVARAPRSES